LDILEFLFIFFDRNGLSEDECFDYFNPPTEEKYHFVVRNWVDVRKI